MNKWQGPEKMLLCFDCTLESPGALLKINLWDPTPEIGLKFPRIFYCTVRV